MKIDEFLREHDVDYEMHNHAPAYTAQEVAAEEHISGNTIAKTVLVRDEKGYAMCVLPASYKLDMRKVTEIRRTHRAVLAEEGEMAKVFPDSEVGAEPPFGNLYNLPTLVDEHLANCEDILFQAGSHKEAIRMKFDDYAMLAKPEVYDLAIHM